MADCNLDVFHENLLEFFKNFKGEIWTEERHRLIYATDASIYRELPKAVFFPKDKIDIIRIIEFATDNEVSIIPRGAGTSLAGQVVGDGLIVDISRYMTEIIEVDESNRTVRVQPGVIRDKLNLLLKDYGLYFGPETSTSNRATIGGMVGNNSSGAGSLRYGTTRESVVSVKVLLSNGEDVEFCPVTRREIEEKAKARTLEGKIYWQFLEFLTDEAVLQEIEKQFPDRSLHRRNHGYSLDVLAESEAFSGSDKLFNIARFLTGSEGTLAFIYEIKLQLFPVSPKYKRLIITSFNDFSKVFAANLELLKFKPYAIELMDDKVLELTEKNPTQQKNRQLIQGNPKAVLITEIADDDEQQLEKWTKEIISRLKEKHLGDFYNVLSGADIPKIWDLRKAGLGVLYNMKGDAKPIGFIEDTAIPPEQLGEYVKEVDNYLNEKKLSCIYYAHIGAGELHLRPILNLKKASDVTLMKEVALKIAKIVKKYNGSLSGEHGDGRLRSEFIPLMLGKKLYSIFKDIKHTWDENSIFNPGKKTDFLPMETGLRYAVWQQEVGIPTVFDFSESDGILRAAERCNGSGDCRRFPEAGGVMCPSFKATGREDYTTRARANIVREYLTKEKNRLTKGAFYEIWQLYSSCLSCKACKSECPSTVDITKMKAELLQMSYDKFGIPLKSRLIANIEKINRWGMIFPAGYNFFVSNKLTGYLIKKMLGFAPQRQLPRLYKISLRKWIDKNFMAYFLEHFPKGESKATVNFFVDEFTNYQDVPVGIAAIKLLVRLGYQINFPFHLSSGRTYLSKGFVRIAKKIAVVNITLLDAVVDATTPLVGIEPSAILTFRDEYVDLADDKDKDTARQLAKNSFTIDEFLYAEMQKGNISETDFKETNQKILVHTHCYQKALSNPAKTVALLNLPKGTQVEEVKSGCCGMAGSFGFEKEHYNL
ncbi:MAG: FAD-binding protein, partial [Bacteroidales bacterium]|nr:FAD-binding protein [Bacteroidales bacterium]